MNTIFIGKNKTPVEVYDSIDELPIKRFRRFNKYILLAAGVGGDLEDINFHIEKVQSYINNEDLRNASKQLENFRLSLYLVSQETNFKHLSFMPFVKSIDGKEVTDISDDNFKRIFEQFQEEPKGIMDRLVDSFKKKLESELALFFPGQFDSLQEKEFFDKLHQKGMLMLETLKNGKDNTAQLKKLDNYLLSLADPKCFSGKESVEIEHDKQFEDMCIFLKKELSFEVTDKTSTFEFYNAFEYLKKNTPKSKTDGRQSA
jgi:hypothetical protein